MGGFWLNTAGQSSRENMYVPLSARVVSLKAGPKYEKRELQLFLLLLYCIVLWRREHINLLVLSRESDVYRRPTRQRALSRMKTFTYVLDGFLLLIVRCSFAFTRS